MGKFSFEEVNELYVDVLREIGFRTLSGKPFDGT